MSYNIQLPGTRSFKVFNNEAVEFPGALSSKQSSFDLYTEKCFSLTNPICLQSDVIYPNALAAIYQPEDGGGPIAPGCVGHQIDNKFPLESKTPFALPFLMYPTAVNGRKHHEVDLCAMPVLNWEAYIQEVKSSHFSLRRGCAVPECDEEPETHPSKEALPPIPEDEDSNMTEIVVPESNPAILQKEKDNKVKATAPMLRDILIATEKTHSVEETPLERTKRIFQAYYGIKESDDLDNEKNEMSKFSNLKLRETSSRPDAHKKNKLAAQTIRRIENFPDLRVEGSWNYLYGGYCGACCFMQTGTTDKSAPKKLKLFVGKGALLRSVELENTSPSSIFSYKWNSLWEEDEKSLPFNGVAGSGTHHPYDDLIFQIVCNESADLTAVRRGKSVQIYSAEKDTPYLLESIPNANYGGAVSMPAELTRKKLFVRNPILTGIDFNPYIATEIATIDENNFVRFCDIGEGCTKDTFILPRDKELSYHLSNRPKDYPCLKLNCASGITFANSNDIFYGWTDSIVYLGDRRDPSISRSHLSPLLDLRNDPHMLLLTDQSTFHCGSTKLNEYISCVRSSSHGTYYYVGTSTKVYLMDRRVPSLPVLSVNHGLQSPLAYMGIASTENFDVIVGSSQRLPETMCLMIDKTHTSCMNRSGCDSKNPVLHCYPRHLSNSRPFFDFSISNGYDFPFPSDFDRIKGHHYAWTTGLSTYPLFLNDPKLPVGFIVATSNNFGDVFWQEWDQEPMPSHIKTRTGDHRFKTFMSAWREAVTPKLSKQHIKPSKNTRMPGDCSILIEPLAMEIQKIRRVRSSKFNVFLPNQLQYTANTQTFTPMNELIPKLRAYKHERVKGILDIWNQEINSSGAPASPVTPEEEITIKEEPEEIDGSLSFGTIDLDTSEEMETSSFVGNELPGRKPYEEIQNEEYEEEELFEYSQPMHTLPTTVESLGDTAEDWLSLQRLSMEQQQTEQASHFGINPETRFFSQGDYGGAASQPLFTEFDTQSQPLPSTSYSQPIQRNSKLFPGKRKSGFL